MYTDKLFFEEVVGFTFASAIWVPVLLAPYYWYISIFFCAQLKNKYIYVVSFIHL